MPVLLSATETTNGMAALTEQVVNSISGLDFTPLYSGMISVVPAVMTVGIAIAGIKKTISFVFGTLFSF